jgi:hypothetical protein
MRHRSFWVMACAACAIATAIGACGSNKTSQSANGAPLQKLKIAVPAVGAQFEAAWLVKLLGYDKQAGLETEVQNAGVSVNTVMASGGADLVMASPAAAVAPANEGLDTSLLYGTLEASSAAFVVGTSDVKSIQDCKDVVTTTEGTGGYGVTVALRDALKAQWKLVTVGDVPSLSASLLSGHANCGVQVLSVWAPGIKSGRLHLVLDPRDPRAALPPVLRSGTLTNALWGVRPRLESKRDAVQRYVGAFHRVYTEVIEKKSPEQIAALLLKDPAFAGQDLAGLAADVKVYREFNWPDQGRITKESWSANLAFLQHTGLSFVKPDDTKFSYASRVDMTYYDRAQHG